MLKAGSLGILGQICKQSHDVERHLLSWATPVANSFAILLAIYVLPTNMHICWQHPRIFAARTDAPRVWRFVNNAGLRRHGRGNPVPGALQTWLFSTTLSALSTWARCHAAYPASSVRMSSSVMKCCNKCRSVASSENSGTEGQEWLNCCSRSRPHSTHPREHFGQSRSTCDASAHRTLAPPQI